MFNFTGLASGPVIACCKMAYWKFDETKIKDECYDSRYDKKNLTENRLFLLGFAVGYFRGW